MLAKLFPTELRQYVPIALLSLLYFAIRLVYCNTAPIWDALVYYEFIVDAQAQPFDIMNYSADHNSALWLLFAGLPNYLFPANYVVYNVWLSFLCTVAVAAFYSIVTALAGKSFNTTERVLLTALFAFHPSIFANEVRVTLDTGVLLFWVFFLYALLKDNLWLAALSGCFLLFTKETTIAHMPILFIFCTLLQPKESWISWAKQRVWAMGIPFSVLGLFLIYKVIYLQQMLFFQGFLQQSSSLIFILPDITLWNYSLNAFVLNFSWVITLLSIILTVKLLRMREHGKILAFAWLLVTTAGVVLGIRHWAHVRYLLPLFPAMLLYFSCVLPAITSQKTRITLLAVLLSAFAWQDVRSIDPVSNAVYCRVQFGTHEVLNIPTHEVCKLNAHTPWLGRDGWIYNLEYAKVPQLIRDIMKDIRPDKDTVFAVQEVFTWEVFTKFDANFEPTFASTGAMPNIVPITVEMLQKPDFVKTLPDTLNYIEFPTSENERIHQLLGADYAKATEKTYDRDGYQLTVYKYEHKTKK